MKNNRKKLGKKRKKVSFSLGIQWNRKLVILLLIFIGVPFGGMYLKNVIEYYTLHERQSNLNREILHTQKTIAQLKQEETSLKTADPETIERLARKQLKYARPGEVIYVPKSE